MPDVPASPLYALIYEVDRHDEASTPGPWDNDAPGCVGKTFAAGGKTTIATTGYRLSGLGEPDAALIASYRTAAPRLADAAEVLHGALDEVLTLLGTRVTPDIYLAVRNHVADAQRRAGQIAQGLP